MLITVVLLNIFVKTDFFFNLFLEKIFCNISKYIYCDFSIYTALLKTNFKKKKNLTPNF